MAEDKENVLKGLDKVSAEVEARQRTERFAETALLEFTLVTMRIYKTTNMGMCAEASHNVKKLLEIRKELFEEINK